MRTQQVAPGQTSTDRPRLPWPLRVLLCLPALLVALFVPTIGLSLTPLGAVLAENSTRAAVVNIVLCAIVCVLAVLITMALMRWIDRRPMRETGWRWTGSSGRRRGAGIGLAVLIVVATTQLLAALGHLERIDVPWAEFGAAGVAITIASGLARAFLLQGIPEELLFRGYLMQTLRAHPRRALVVSTVFFGIIHIVSAGGQANLTERFIYLATPTGFGFLAAVLVLRLRSVWPAVGIHAGFHVGTMITGLTGVNTTDPGAWVAMGLVFSAAGLVGLRGSDWSRPGGRER